MRYVVLAIVGVGCSSKAVPPPVEPVHQAPVVSVPPEPLPTEPAFRLPGDVVPTSYALDLKVLPDVDNVEGMIVIEANVVRPTRVVWLHQIDLLIPEARVGGQAADPIIGTDMVGLRVARELPVGPTTIMIPFATRLDRQKSRGIYAEKEGADNYVYTFFEPTDARRAFPCFDEPSYKVPWKLTFHVKKEHVALANAPVVREVDEANGMKRVELAVSKPMPSYLVAFIVGPFELVDGGVAGRAKTQVRFAIPKGRAGELGYAKQVTPKVVAALESYFDMPYPYEKLDVAVVPRYWGTMEHPGIVAMGQPLTLIRPDQETRARKQAYTQILAHELAHYWFGDYVTMAWWDDTWLNESLAQWMDIIITDAVDPTWRFRERRVGSATSAMDADEHLATDAIKRPVTTRDGIEASFDNAITYDKGASILRMFEASVTPEKFKTFIRAYIRAHAWGTASAEDLLQAAREQLGPDDERAMRGFIEQPGVPRISGELACGAHNKLVLKQTRSLPAGVTDPEKRAWRLPVCVRWGDKTAHRACTTLDRGDGELDLGATCPKWIVLNADATGYYRSVVDVKMAKALLASKLPTSAEKMMLVADLRAAVKRDEIAIDKLLEIVPLVAADRDEKVAQWAFEAGSINLGALDDALYAKAKQFMLRTYGPYAKKLGWTRKPADSDERHALRSTFVPPVATLDPALTKEATALATRWLADGRGIDDDLVAGVLVTSARNGNQAWFDKLLAAAKAATDRREKQRLLYALSAFRDPAIAKQALAIVRGTELDLRESSVMLYGLLFARETRELGVTFLEAHIDELLARMRDDQAAGFLGALAGGACEKTQRDRLVALVEPRAKKVSGAETYVTRGLEDSAQCIVEFQRQLPALKRFLERQR